MCNKKFCNVSKRREIYTHFIHDKQINCSINRGLSSEKKNLKEPRAILNRSIKL